MGYSDVYRDAIDETARMSLKGIMRLDNTRAGRLALAKLYRNSRRQLARSSRVE
jgi:hypothetical protein